jgi:hypothetical protein
LMWYGRSKLCSKFNLVGKTAKELSQCDRGKQYLGRLRG